MPARNAKMVTLIVEGTQSNGNIIGVMPNNDDAAQLGPMRTALLSTVERPRDADDRLAELPYRIGDMSGMHVFQNVPGSLVGLTDGPSDDIETASTQNFAMLVSMDMGGATYDPTGELGAMVQRLKQQYPDVSILSSEVIDAPGGKLGEIRYERTTKASNVIVGGVTWAKPLGSNVLVIVAQHPRGDDAAFARLVRLRDGIKPK
jgi:hypothetical protein